MAVQMKSVKRRIKSVENTMQITWAMELVASSRLRRAKERAEDSRPAASALYQAVRELSAAITGSSSVYAHFPASDTHCYVVVAGDRGLAGGYNSNLLKKFEEVSKDQTVVLLPIGKKAVEYARRKQIPVIIGEYAQAAAFSIRDCRDLARRLCEGYEKREYGSVDLVSTGFHSMLSVQPVCCPLLPLKRLVPERRTHSAQMLFDPEAETVLEAIVPEFLTGMIYGGVCDSLVSELAARRNAMESATGNAREMIERLKLQYNRARQAGVTQEISEIVGGMDEMI